MIFWKVLSHQFLTWVRANQCLWHSLFVVFVHYLARFCCCLVWHFASTRGPNIPPIGVYFKAINKGFIWHQSALGSASLCCQKIVVFKLASGVASNTNFKHFCWPLWLVIVASFSLLVFLQFGHFFWSIWSILCALFSTQSSLKSLVLLSCSSLPKFCVPILTLFELVFWPT